LQQNSKWRLKRGENPFDFDAPGLVRTSPAAANIIKIQANFGRISAGIFPTVYRLRETWGQKPDGSRLGF
jgi:hypothetical protein